MEMLQFSGQMTMSQDATSREGDRRPPGTNISSLGLEVLLTSRCIAVVLKMCLLPVTERAVMAMDVAGRSQ